jgi:hypothetical protein
MKLKVKAPNVRVLTKTANTALLIAAIRALQAT